MIADRAPEGPMGIRKGWPLKNCDSVCEVVCALLWSQNVLYVDVNHVIILRCFYRRYIASHIGLHNTKY